MDPGLDRPNTGIRGSNDAHVVYRYDCHNTMILCLLSWNSPHAQEHELNILERDCLWGDIDWIHPAYDSDQWRALVNTVMNLRIP
jgi:hypothetical protein